MGQCLVSASDGSGALWSETQNNISVSNGVFSVNLGASAVIPETVFNTDTAYLEVTVAGETLLPRQRFLASPYAVNSAKLGGQDITYFASKSYVDSLLGGGSNPSFASLSVTGSLGVGTAAPSTKLEVAGQMRSVTSVGTVNSLSGTAVDWNDGNVQTTSASCGAMA